ncbi:MAG: hypothetical protein A2413_14470 [Treponema sp. RIFOXYC1_FULL_61_9]|nr:MAG: hypothetical protein A2413_14470 [Treponema sp. RIFOXYC1_FULL_61_9]
MQAILVGEGIAAGIRRGELQPELRADGDGEFEREVVGPEGQGGLVRMGTQGDPDAAVGQTGAGGDFPGLRSDEAVRGEILARMVRAEPGKYDRDAAADVLS